MNRKHRLAGRTVGRRTLIRGTLIAGAGVGGAGLTAAALENRKGSSDRSNTASASADARFVSAVEFLSEDALRVVQGWPGIEFPKDERAISASIAMPRDSALITVDLLWTTETGGTGDVRWIGGVNWIDPAIPLTDDASGARWNAAVVAIPDQPLGTTTTRLGTYSVDPGGAALNVRITREGRSADDTYDGSVILLGATVTVEAALPFA